MLTAEELLAGGALTYEVSVPGSVLAPGQHEGNGMPYKVRLRPLTVRDLQLISRAAKESDSLVASLMVQRSLMEPELSVPQVTALHIGLVQFLLQEVNRISGISSSAEQVSSALEAPLTKAAFVLAREFGWTPQQISELTFGQLLLHLQMLEQRADQ